jgi:hypothetical protein
MAEPTRAQTIEILGHMTNMFRMVLGLTDPEMLEYKTVPTAQVMEGMQRLYPGFCEHLKQSMEADGCEYRELISAADLAEIFVRGEFIIDNNDGTCQINKFMLERFEAEKAGDSMFGGKDGSPGLFNFKSRG